MHGVICEKLREIEAQENVRILFAIESGSRAWGFPSPDSDYDARYVYVRPKEWYLSITPGRDVLELPIDDLLDINGWDIKKALGLLMKPNPVMLEWLSSPIRYIWDEDLCAKLNTFAQKTTYGTACAYHYLSLGSRQWKTYVEGRDEINLKKYFYIVRPALCLRWLRMHPTQIPPMNFQALLAGVDLDAHMHEELFRLLALKSKSKEMGLGPRTPLIDDFIQREFALVEETLPSLKAKRPRLLEEANDLFREIVDYSSL